MIKTSKNFEIDHQLKMLDNLETMNQEKRMCDITIIVGDNEYPAHKNILSASSKYFQELLKSNMKDAAEGKISLIDVDPECAKSCIDFVYSGKLIIPPEKFFKLAHAARIMKIVDVTIALNELLWRFLQNCTGKPQVEKGLIVQLHDILSHTHTEQNEEYYRFRVCLRTTEEKKLTAILQFIEYHPNEEKHLFDMVQLVDISKLSQEYLEELLEKNPVIVNNFRSCNLLKERIIESRQNRERRSNTLIVIFDDYRQCCHSYDHITDEVMKFCELVPTNVLFITALDEYLYAFADEMCVFRLHVPQKELKWERIQDTILYHPRKDHVTSLTGSLFAYGSDEKIQDIEKYDPALNQWFLLGQRLGDLCDSVLVSHSDSIYFIGGSGRTPNEPPGSLTKFKPASSEWTELQSMHEVRYQIAAEVAGSKIFVAGVSDDYQRPCFQCYDICNNIWTKLSPPILDRGDGGELAVHRIDGFIYLVGYRDLDLDNRNHIEKYDIANDRWHEVEIKGISGGYIFGSALMHMK